MLFIFHGSAAFFLQQFLTSSLHVLKATNAAISPAWCNPVTHALQADCSAQVGVVMNNHSGFHQRSKAWSFCPCLSVYGTCRVSAQRP